MPLFVARHGLSTSAGVILRLLFSAHNIRGYGEWMTHNRNDREYPHAVDMYRDTSIGTIGIW